MSEHDDYALIRQCVSGNTRAFEPLVDRYQRPIFNVALKMVNDSNAAEDITQTVFLKAYDKLDTFRPKFKFFSWIYRMAVNESLNHLKARKRHEQIGPGFTAPEKNPEQQVLDAELQRKIQDMLMVLQPDYRAVIILRHFEELSYHEIAYILDITEKKVKSRLFTARQRLREILTRKGTTEK